MNQTLFNNHRKKLSKIAEQYNWFELRAEPDQGKLTFSEELGAYIMEVWCSKMTVAIKPKNRDKIYLYNQDVDKIEALFKNPYEL